MDDGSPTLEVGFAIDFHDSFGQLKSLDDLIGKTAADTMREFQRIEAVTKGFIDLGTARAQISSFNNEMRSAAQETNRVERAGEGLLRQLNRQVETFGKTSSEIRQMRAELRAVDAAGRGLTDLAVKIRAASAEMDRLEAAAGRVGPSSNAARASMQNLGFQMQDFAVQVVGGTSVLRAFSMQAPQAAGALTGFEGKLGAVGRFLNGPWGIALTLATVLIAGFADKIFAQNNALNDAVDKLKKDAAETDVTARAKERFKLTQEGVSAAIREQTEAFKKAADAERSAADQANIAAKIEFNREMQIRSTTVALLEQAKAKAELAKSLPPSGNPEADDMAITLANSRVASLDAQLKTAEQGLADARRNVQNSRIDIAAEEAKRLTDPMERIKKMYDDQVGVAKSAARARIAAGVELDHAGTVALASELARIERARQAAIKAEQDKQSAAKKTFDQIGRNISLAEARQIAQSAGGRVTSDLRSTDVQKGLYDKYMAYKAGTGPWAALAAKPGTSNHELGQAVDVAKGNGVTLAKLVAAYKVAGVRVTEALDEGDHYHIAWKKVGEAARQQSAEAAQATRDAKKAQEEYQKLMDAARDWGRLDDRVRSAREGGAGASAKLREDTESVLGYKMGSDQDPFEQLLRSQQAANDYERAVETGMDKATSAVLGHVDVWGDLTTAIDGMSPAVQSAFGQAGSSAMAALRALAKYGQQQELIRQQMQAGGLEERQRKDLAKQSTELQLNSMISLTGAAKGMFKEHSTGYQVMMAAEKALTIVQLARTAVDVAGGAARMFASLGPFAFPAVAAMLGVMATLGFASGGGGGTATLPKSNDGSGTVLGDGSAKSESIKRAIDALKEVDTLMLSSSREMATYLKSIDSQIGGVASQLVRTGTLDTKVGTVSAPKGILGSLFGAKYDITGTGIAGWADTLGNVLKKGLDVDTYSDVLRTKKTFGITTGTSAWTDYTDQGQGFGNQFTLILKSFSDAIGAAAGPLGSSTNEVLAKLDGFVVDIGKVELSGLSGTEIAEKLAAVFGAVGDKMATTAFPGIEKFQKVGEGAFETLVRVASTVEAVTANLDMLGMSAARLGIDAKVGIADQFESISAMTDAVQGYMQTYYSKEEQAAAKSAQFGKVFDSLGLAMPGTLAAFRQLVEAQDLTTASGQSTYATLLQLAPAFADLQSSLNGAKSAAEVLSERQDLQRQMLELNGDTAAIRALDLTKLDASNRALQQQVWAVQDAQKAAEAAQQLRDAWTSVGDSIMDEVKRIRGVTDAAGGGGFASLMSQFNTATASARGGDQDAAKSLPGLSQALLKAAADAATSRQELDRVQAQIAASLEGTYGFVARLAGTSPATSVSDKGLFAGTSPLENSIAALDAAAPVSPATPANDDMASEIRALREEVAALRSENNAGHAATAGNTGRAARTLENVTAASGGEAITVASAAA